MRLWWRLLIVIKQSVRKTPISACVILCDRVCPPSFLVSPPPNFCFQLECEIVRVYVCLRERERKRYLLGESILGARWISDKQIRVEPDNTFLAGKTAEARALYTSLCFWHKLPLPYTHIRILESCLVWCTQTLNHD